MKLIYSMANISQTDLLVKTSQDTTDNSKDSEQNLQLLKFRPGSSQKSSGNHTRIRTLYHLQKSTVYLRKGKKTWLTFQICCDHFVKKSALQYLQQKTIVNIQSTYFRLTLNEHDTNGQKKQHKEQRSKEVIKPS